MILGVSSVVSSESTTVGGTSSGDRVDTASVGGGVVDCVVTAANVSAGDRVSEDASGTTAKISVRVEGGGTAARKGSSLALSEDRSVTAELSGSIIRSISASWDCVILSTARLSVGKSVSSTTVECVG